MIPLATPAIRISIVEDHELTRQILGDLIRKTPHLRYLGGFADSESAIAGLLRTRPDVVLMDISLPTGSGVECVRHLKPLLPQTQFLMLTIYEDTDHIFDALAAGATGYLLKTTRQKDLIAGIRQIYEGGSPMTGAIARKVVRSFTGVQDAPPREGTLSAREEEVLGLLAQGLLYKEIAAALHLGIPTVSTYVRRIYEKLQVRSRGQASAKYFKDQSDRRALAR
jgi:DNA-binding NarL/FixJ family response regulator